MEPPVRGVLVVPEPAGEDGGAAADEQDLLVGREPADLVGGQERPARPLREVFVWASDQIRAVRYDRRWGSPHELLRRQSLPVPSG